MIVCGEAMAKFYESIGLKVERPKATGLMKYVLDEPIIVNPDEVLIINKEGKVMGKKKGGKKC